MSTTTLRQAQGGAYDRLLADLGATFRPQRQWVEGRGLLLIIGHFLSGVGAGAWLFALAFDQRAGLAAATATVALAGVFHLLFLGRPERFWRMFRAKSSWIARGFVGMNLFVPGALLYFVFPDGYVGGAFLAVSLLGAAILIVYKGNVYAASKGMPFWNSPLLPVLYAAYALRGGGAALLVLLPFAKDGADEATVGLIELWIGLSAAVMLGFYLGVMRNATRAAQRSVAELMHGRVALVFYLGTLGAGLVVPIAAGVVGLAAPLSEAVLAVVACFSLGGDFFAKYAIAKAGVYVPLMPTLGEGARPPR